MSAVLLTLNELIGETPDITYDQEVMKVRALDVAIFKCTSSLATQKNKPTVIAVHGGPACCHNYMLPLKLLTRDGYNVVFYDQAGCGKSTVFENPEIEAPWLFRLEYYVEELQALISYLQLTEYYLYGSSWGTIIIQELAVLKPHGLLGIVLDGALSDAELYITTQWRDRISTLPMITQNLMKKCIEDFDFSSPLYHELNDIMSKHFTCRLIPRPDCYTDSLKLMNMTIYSKMQGDCEFMIGGIMKSWNITNRLHLIECPTLVLVGEFDTMTEECSQVIVDNIPHSWPLVIIPRAAHCKLCDEPFLCVEATAKFLNTIQAITRRKEEQQE